jgi:hypothetical protein
MDAALTRPVAGRALAIGVAQGIIWCVACAGVIKMVPQFQKIFADFGTELPAMTRLLILLCYLLYSYWYLALLVVCLLNWGIASLVFSSSGGVFARRAWFVATWLAPLAFLGFVIVALAVPLLSILTRLS